ncbi:MAG: beta-eliminating lyase-related protein [Gammaproteobacteria bacterium]
MPGNFRSDNEYPVAPEIMAALAAVNEGSAHSYGADDKTSRVAMHLRELFERDLEVYPLVSGTAANALAAAQTCGSIGAVICHRDAHLNTDECGAPEFFSGGAKLEALDGPHGKLLPGDVERSVATALAMGEHASRPRMLSLTQATELGTVYRPEEVEALAEVAHRDGLRVHMDGARLANAVASLGCSPAEITWRCGVDLLSFGATKNGAMMAEALVVFDPADSVELPRRRKQAGHLISKMRYVSAQLEAYVADGLWLRLAGHANRLAQKLSEGLAALPEADLLHPVESNELFVRLPDALAAALRERGFEFHDWPHTGPDVYRFVTSFATPEEAVDGCIEAARALGGEGRAAARA